jgi:hypothetical protein
MWLLDGTDDDIGIGEKELVGYEDAIGTGLNEIGEGLIPSLPTVRGDVETMLIPGEGEAPIGMGEAAPSMDTGEGDDRGDVLLLLSP